MSNTTGTPETFQGMTNRHHLGIYRAHMAATDAAIAILTADPATRALAETILAAFNDLADHTAELIKLQQTQIDLLEAFCQNRDHKDELRSTPKPFDPDNHEYEECGNYCELHRKYGTYGTPK